MNLHFQLRAKLAAVHDNASPEYLRAVTGRVVADLRAAADQIERKGLSGYWENVPAAGADADGYPRVSHALKYHVPHNKTDVNGPACLPRDVPAQVADLIAQLDRLSHAAQCVFPDDVANAAREIIAADATVHQEMRDAAFAYKMREPKSRDVLSAYRDAYAHDDHVAKQLFARAIWNHIKA